MATFEPLTDFDWLKVNWEAPDQLRTEHCSYCGDKFPEHGTEARAAFIPLIISTNTGCVAEFCEPCQMTWWGLHWDPDRIGFGPHEPEIGHPADCQICEDAGCPACEGGDAAFARWARGEVRACRVCGCTDDRACRGGCYWVEPDLCSSCVPRAPSPWSLK